MAAQSRRRRRRASVILVIAVAAALGVGGGFLVARQVTRPAIEVPDHQPSAANGAYVFAAAGCAGCHTAAEEGARMAAGGRVLATPFGTFHGPNITADPDFGIGGWSDEDFLRALTLGVAPDGRDYYPVFPYPSFTGMTGEDMLDLKAYLFSLPTAARPNAPHDVSFPFSLRPLLTGWKFLFFEPGPPSPEPGRDASWHRGRYLATSLGHCAECHSPRNSFGATTADAHLAGTELGPGGAAIPNITPHDATGIGAWTEGDLGFFLLSGMLPDGDFAGDEMREVIRDGTSKLTEADRAALVTYLMSLPPVDNRIGPAEDETADRSEDGEDDEESWN